MGTRLSRGEQAEAKSLIEQYRTLLSAEEMFDKHRMTQADVATRRTMSEHFFSAGNDDDLAALRQMVDSHPYRKNGFPT